MSERETRVYTDYGQTATKVANAPYIYIYIAHRGIIHRYRKQPAVLRTGGEGVELLANIPDIARHYRLFPSIMPITLPAPACARLLHISKARYTPARGSRIIIMRPPIPLFYFFFSSLSSLSIIDCVCIRSGAGHAFMI